MPAPTPIVFTVTDAGRLAALTAAGTGLSLTLATLRASTGKITPDGTETALTGTLRGSWSLGGGAVEPTSKTLRFFALVQSSSAIGDIFSLGLFDNAGNLFAIASTTGSTPLIYVNANIDFLPSFGVRLPGITASSITIETDPNAPLAMSLMAAHLAAAHPHSQYIKVDHVATADAVGLIQLATQSEVNAGLVPNKAVTPKTLKDFLPEYEHLHGTNGMQTLPGGLVIQWGTVNSVVADADATTFSFPRPTAFTATPYGVGAFLVGTAYNLSTTGISVSAEAISPTQGKIVANSVVTGSSVTVSVFWIAIGK